MGYDYQDEDRLPRLATKRNNFIDPFSGNFGTNSHKLVNKTMDNHHKGKTHSLFIHDLISFNDNFKISLGARFDRYKFSSRNIKEESNSYKDDVFSPQAGLIYTFYQGIIFTHLTQKLRAIWRKRIFRH